MLNESGLTTPELGRPLRTEESALIRILLAGVYSTEELEKTLRNSRVADMQDGGMGSIRFVGPGPKTFGTVLVRPNTRTATTCS